ncbi:MAG: flagellar biosynthesis anti-sigma factor FlgM [Bryobacterales bacterium]|nr:flagellar biosynthesis anti-sigma factor FlgM [Bryobacterales bacterium]
MKINHGYQDSRAASAQDTAKTQETAATAKAHAAKAGAGAGRVGAGDQVNLSPLAAALQGALSDSPERSAYLERLATDYAAGSYQPDASATANGIISDTLLEPPDSKKP